MITQAYCISVRITIRTLERLQVMKTGDELFSDRNVFPRGCIVKMEKINL